MFLLLFQNEEYLKKGVECLDNCMSLLNNAGWKDQKKGNVDGDIVQSMDTDKFGKIYLMTVISRSLNKIIKSNFFILFRMF